MYTHFFDFLTEMVFSPYPMILIVFIRTCNRYRFRPPFRAGLLHPLFEGKAQELDELTHRTPMSSDVAVVTCTVDVPNVVGFIVGVPVKSELAPVLGAAPDALAVVREAYSDDVLFGELWVHPKTPGVELPITRQKVDGPTLLGFVVVVYTFLLCLPVHGLPLTAILVVFLTVSFPPAPVALPGFLFSCLFVHI